MPDIEPTNAANAEGTPEDALDVTELDVVSGGLLAEPEHAEQEVKASHGETGPQIHT
jgi:hypothetical protein